MTSSTQAVAAAAVGSSRRSNGGGQFVILWWLGGVVAIALLWEGIGRSQVLGAAWPPLTKVLQTFSEQSTRELFGRALVATFMRAGRGYALGIGVAFAVAAVVILVPRLHDGFYRLAAVVNAIPLIAIGPLVVATLARENAPVVAAMLAVFFSTLVAAISGLAAAGSNEHDLFSVLGASKRARLWRLQLPAAIPTLLSGLKLAVPAAVLGEILGEWFGSDRGLGILLLTSMDSYRMDMLWATALVAGALSMFFYGVLVVLEHAAILRYPRSNDFRQVSPSLRRGITGSVLRYIAPFWAVILLIALWQWWVTAGEVPRIVLPAPFEVFMDLFTNPMAYMGAAAYTIGVSLLGLCVGMALGAAMALIMSRFHLVRAMMLPSAVIFQSIPVVVAIPVIARIVGYADQTVIVVAIGISFFPSFVLIESGLRMAPPGTEDVFSTLGSNANRRLRLLRLPSAVPNAFVALRISAASCVLGALTADWLIGQNGLGAMFGRERSRLGIDRAWGAVLLSTALSVAGFLLAVAIERRGRERVT